MLNWNFPLSYPITMEEGLILYTMYPLLFLSFPILSSVRFCLFSYPSLLLRPTLLFPAPTREVNRVGENILSYLLKARINGRATRAVNRVFFFPFSLPLPLLSSCYADVKANRAFQQRRNGTPLLAR